MTTPARAHVWAIKTCFNTHLSRVRLDGTDNPERVYKKSHCPIRRLIFSRLLHSAKYFFLQANDICHDKEASNDILKHSSGPLKSILNSSTHGPNPIFISKNFCKYEVDFFYFVILHDYHFQRSISRRWEKIFKPKCVSGSFTGFMITKNYYVRKWKP